MQDRLNWKLFTDIKLRGRDGNRQFVNDVDPKRN